MISAAAAFWLDVLRAGAAVAVLVGHWRNLFFVDAAGAEPLSVAGKAFYFATGFGHIAVIVFFVMSGLLVSPTIWRGVTGGTFSWPDYLNRRLSRLLIVLVPALAAGWLLDHAGLALFGDADIYRGDKLGGNIVTWDIDDRSTFLVYLGNLFFLQNIKVYAAGTNGPLWSLSYEFWYYVLFPCAAIALFGKTSPLRRVLLASAVLAAGHWILTRSVIDHSLFWLFGAVVAVARMRGVGGSAGFPWIAATVFLVAISYVRSRPAHVVAHHLTGYQAFGVAALATAFLLHRLLAMSGAPSAPAPIARLARAGAGFSYTLYLTHLPLLVFLRAAFVRGERWQPEGLPLLAAAGLLALTVAYCYGFSRLTEAHTDRLRQAVQRRFARRPAPVPAVEAPARRRHGT